MAGNAKRGGGGDRILESRHLVGLFLGVVLLCGVFFTLGYVMGRTQFGGAVHAADSPVKNLSPVVAPTKTSSRSVPEAAKPGPDNWDFDPKPAEKRPEPPPPAKSTALPAVFNKDPNPPAPPPAKPANPKETARFQPPNLAKNSIVVQVAAEKQQRDALNVADELQRKKFPSFVASSPADSFYHVQVGPYPDLAAAENAKRALEQLGFKPIIKH